MKQIDEDNLNELNKFLKDRDGLEICSVNLADLAGNYVELLNAARNNQTNLGELIENSIKKEETVKASTVQNAKPVQQVKPVQKAEVKQESAPVTQKSTEAKATQTLAAKTTQQATTEAVQKEATTVKETATKVAKEEPKKATEPKAADPAIKKVVAAAIPATPVATNVTIFEGSAQPYKAKANDIWRKSLPNKKVQTYEFDGHNWNLKA